MYLNFKQAEPGTQQRRESLWFGLRSSGIEDLLRVCVGSASRPIAACADQKQVEPKFGKEKLYRPDFND